MTKLALDAATLAKLGSLNDLTELTNEAGQTVGFFHPLVRDAAAEKQRIRSPFTDEEIQRRRQQRTGCSLDELLKRLENT